MFQYATGLAVAKKNNTDLVLDTVFLNDRFPRRNFTYRTYDLDIFTLEPKFTRLSKISTSMPIPGLWLGIDLGLIRLGATLGRRVIKEKKESLFDPGIFYKQGDILLWGRWEDEKYFADIAIDIRSAFTFRDPFVGEAVTISDDIRSSNSVSVHVRRGDFAALKNVMQLMGETDLSYYERATNYIASHVDKPKFFVFSDDIDWCKKNLALPFPTVYVPASAEGPKAAFHLRLMSLCKHDIIANSTFSWWSAWLNANPEKIVVAPKKWYANLISGDIVPKQWIRI
jgi:hypothetical protein